MHACSSDYELYCKMPLFPSKLHEMIASIYDGNVLRKSTYDSHLICEFGWNLTIGVKVLSIPLVKTKFNRAVCVGLGRNGSGFDLGWVGSQKSDPRATLHVTRGLIKCTGSYLLSSRVPTFTVAGCPWRVRPWESVISVHLFRQKFRPISFGNRQCGA